MIDEGMGEVNSKGGKEDKAIFTHKHTRCHMYTHTHIHTLAATYLET